MSNPVELHQGRDFSRQFALSYKKSVNCSVFSHIHGLSDGAVLDALIDAAPQVDLVRNSGFHFNHYRPVQ